MLRSPTMLALLAVSSLTSGAPDLMQQAKEFHARHTALGEAFDASIADLYADEAQVRMFRRYPHGLERSMAMTGTQWKELIRVAMPVARARNDRSEYFDIGFEESEGRVRITAKRRAVSKCYVDSGYYMVVAPQADGSLTIIEEYMETQPQSSC